MRSQLLAEMMMAAVLPVATSPPNQGVVEVSKGHYECSAGAGKFAQTDISQLVKGDVLRGRIKFLQEHQGSIWNSAGALAFRLADGSVVGVFLTLLHGDRHHAYLMLKLPGAGEDQLLGRLPGDEAVVRVILDKRGRLRVRSGWMSRTVQLNNPKVIGRVVHCQSGKFQFAVGGY